MTRDLADEADYFGLTGLVSELDPGRAFRRRLEERKEAVLRTSRYEEFVCRRGGMGGSGL